MLFFSIKTKDAETVKKILNRESAIEFSGLNVLKDSLTVGQVVFIVLGGDRPIWDPGLVGMGIISRQPYDVGYEGRNYRIQVDIKLLLTKSIKRKDLVHYKDTFGIIGIAPIVNWEPNQALSEVEEHKAIALMRAMLDMDPDIDSDLSRLMPPQIMSQIKGVTTMYVEVDVPYGTQGHSIVYSPQESIEAMVSDVSENYATESPVQEILQPYSKEDFLAEAFIEEDKYDEIVEILGRKKNIILQGAPGVGKSFIAKRLAYSLLKQKDDSKIEFVQFHQSYSYEDFVVGYKPTETGFKIEYGPFYKFCKKAETTDDLYFFIIDEINRGNLSRIFGELLMLIEATKRNEKATLLYTQEAFHVPDNVYIIGMMNTADRSLAMLDYALRRRFGFFTMEPAFELDSFSRQIEKINNPKAEALIDKLKSLNHEIEQDSNLGHGFKIGHSYFCVDNAKDDTLKAIVKHEIIPLLVEYWYDEPSKVERWTTELMSAFKGKE